MTNIEAMKLALEGAANYIDTLGGDSRKYRQAISEATVKESLMVQQAEQEPVGWVEYDTHGNFSGLYREYGEGLCEEDFKNGWRLEPLYTAPPQREWVSLTDDEIAGTAGIVHDIPTHPLTVFARAIEAKLKELNHGAA